MSMPDRQVVSLTLQIGDGEQETVELPGPGGTIRCGVGEPGCRSGVWRIWSNPKKSDVYVAIRALAGYQKWSLHESGDWRFQWLTDARAAEFSGSTNRIIDQWEQPAEVGASGMTKGFSIWVRPSDIVAIDNDDDPGHAKVQWLPAPPPGYAMGVHIIVARPDQGFVHLPGAFPFDGYTLADGRVVLVLMQRREFTEEANAGLRDTQREWISRSDVDWETVASPRMVMSGSDDQGNRFVWDAAVTRENLQ
ncbi:hypothetical protein [Nocardia tengchongensis]|uniref:hypothetical protein n=1 Tax=Nocardia tengchongensis TaxID=2055889 RepID=UPI0036CAACA7